MTNGLYRHADVEDLKQKVKMTFAWDFIFSEGDTIKDKYQRLYSIVSTSCVRKNESTEIALVIGSKIASSFIAVCHDDTRMIPKYEERDDIIYVGDFYRDCGGNGYNTNFHLYQDDKLSDEEIIVALGDKVSLIKLFNCP